MTRTRLSVSALRLSHFRSHLAADLTLDHRPVAVFGPNGAGKTNLIEAVSLLSPGRGLRGAGSDALIRKPEALGWRVAATLDSFGRVHEVDTRAEAGQPRRTRIDEKAATLTGLGRIARVLWLVPAMDRLWIEGADGRRRFLDRMTLSFEPRHAEVSLAYEKAMRDRNRLLRDEVRDPHWYRALEAQMSQCGAAIIANRARALERLGAAQAEAITGFPTADIALGSPSEATVAVAGTADDLATALAEGRARDMRAGRSLNGPHRADLQATYRAKGVPAAQCSTGEQKALLIALVLANARALAAELGAPPLLLLDEVAAHLDADRRAALYDEICGLGAQAWMTGTGPELFSELGTRAQALAVIESGGESTVRPGDIPSGTGA